MYILRQRKKQQITSEQILIKLLFKMISLCVTFDLKGREILLFELLNRSLFL